jgi:WD40 repeat protein
MSKNLYLIVFLLCQTWISFTQIIEDKKVFYTGENIYNVAYSFDGKLIAINYRNKIDICTADSMKVVENYPVKSYAMDFSKKSSLFTYGVNDGTVFIWDIYNNQLIKTIRAHNSLITCIKFSSNDSLIATACIDSTIRIWSIGTGSMIAELKGHKGWINDIEFTLDNKYIISCSSDKSILLWDYKNQQVLKSFNVHKNWVRAIAICPDSLTFASSGDDKKIFIFSLQDSSYSYPLKKSHNNIITDIQFIDKNYLVSIGHDYKIVLNNINIPTETKILKLFKGNPQYSGSLLLYPGDKYLSSLAINSKENYLTVGSLGKGLITTTGIHDFIVSPHEVILKKINNVEINTAKNLSEFRVNNPTCMIEGKISRAESINSAKLWYINENKIFTLRLNKRGEFKTQVLITGSSYDYSIIIEDKDINLGKVKYDFTLVKIE